MGISYPVGEFCRRFTKLTAYTLHSNPIPNRWYKWLFVTFFVTYISQIGHQCFPACFCHPTVGSFDVSPYQIRYENILQYSIPIVLITAGETSINSQPYRAAHDGGSGGNVSGICEGKPPRMRRLLSKASESRVPLQRLYAGHQATIDYLLVWV